MPYDLVMYVGRFEPFHIAHLDNISKGLKFADNLLLIIGSCYRKSDFKNPFSYAERLDMLKGSLELINPDANKKIYSVPSLECIYNDDVWQQHIEDNVNKFITLELKQDAKDVKIALIGHHKDESSYYLKMFPSWHFEHLSAVYEQDKVISATTVRNALWDENLQKIEGIVSPYVQQKLSDFAKTERYKKLQADYKQSKLQQGSKAVVSFSLFDGDKVLLQEVENEYLSFPQIEIDEKSWLLNAALQSLSQKLSISDELLNIIRNNAKLNVFDYPKRRLELREVNINYSFDFQQFNLSINVDDFIKECANLRWLNIVDINREKLNNDCFDIMVSLNDDAKKLPNFDYDKIS